LETQICKEIPADYFRNKRAVVGLSVTTPQKYRSKFKQGELL